MASKSERIGALRFDIIADDGQFERSMRGAFRMTKNLKNAMEKTKSPIVRFTQGARQASRALDQGLITFKAYNFEMDRLKVEMNQATGVLNRNTKAVLANNTARRVGLFGGGLGRNAGNIGGAFASAAGMGGVGGAVGRVAGMGAMGGISGAIGLGAPLIGLMAEVKAVKEYAKVEASQAELQVYLGTKKGIETSDVFRDIAKNSSLTTEQLVKNAAVLKSYGNSFESLTDFTRRLGQASGGDTAQFANLTKAFAQINAMGRLMGQEKNQLVNAGFSLKLIAKEAGVAMVDFAKAMEEGLITAEHVNAALMTATNEGGLYGDRLERRGNTTAGMFDIMKNNLNEVFANFGESQSGFWKSLLGSISGWAKTTQEFQTLRLKRERLDAENNKFLMLIERNTRKRDPSGITPTDQLQDSLYNGGYRQSHRQGLEGQLKFFPSWVPGLGGGNAGGWDSGISEGWSSGGSLMERLDAILGGSEYASRMAKQRLHESKYRNQQYRHKMGVLGIDTGDEDAQDPDVFIEPDIASAGKGKPSGTDFSANTLEEYKFITGKIKKDMDTGRKTVDMLGKIHKALIGKDPEQDAEVGRKGWRRRQGEPMRKAREWWMSDVAPSIGDGIRSGLQFANDSIYGVKKSAGVKVNESEAERWDKIVDRVYKEADLSGNGLLGTDQERELFSEMYKEERERFRQQVKDRKDKEEEARREAERKAATQRDDLVTKQTESRNFLENISNTIGSLGRQSMSTMGFEGI